MKEVIIWIFNLISEFISTSMTWKIYGEFSLTHFIFGAIFLISVFSLFGFAFPKFGDSVSFGFSAIKNEENKKEKARYYSMTKSTKYADGTTVYHKYKVNRETGEATKV